MGITQLLARYAARRAHVLTVEAPGYWMVRAEADRRLRGRGWCAATSPADADVLAVCGSPGPELSEAIDRVWDQLPGPRVRVELPNPEMVESALDRAAVQLVDVDIHRNDARERAQMPDLSGDHQMGHGGMGHGERQHAHHQHMNHDAMDHGEHGQHQHMDHSAVDHAGMDHGQHGHMHHGDMDMAPAGIALAEGGDDRDGLEMDVLHVRLGPVLRYWPAGLVVRCSLQGDVLTKAEASVVDGDNTTEEKRRSDADDDAVLAAARHCDHVTDLLMLAGWPRAAATARTARDSLLTEHDVDRGRSLLDNLHGTLRRSRVLRWSLRHLASLAVEDCERLRLPAALAGDCYDRLLTRVDTARDLLSNPLALKHFDVGFGGIVDALPDLVVGLELATARLVIASLAIDTTTMHRGGRDG